MNSSINQLGRDFLFLILSLSIIVGTAYVCDWVYWNEPLYLSENYIGWGVVVVGTIVSFIFIIGFIIQMYKALGSKIVG